MATSKDPRLSTINVKFEEPPPKELQLMAFGVDAEGKPAGSAPLRDGTFDAATLEKGGAVRAFIAPAPPQDVTGREQPTLTALERQRAVEVPLKARASAVLSKSLIDFWKWCFCVINGTVVRPVTSGSITVDYPVCKARVHIMEVDPWWILIDRIPIDTIFRVRDEIFNLTRIPPIIPPIIRKPIPGPFPEPDPGPLQLDQIANLPRLAAIKPTPAISLQDAVKQLPQEVMLSLSTQSPIALRQALVAQKRFLTPLLCWFPWFFVRTEEIAVVETDENGRFSHLYAYLCAGDRPDLYFWVEYQIGGVWQTVYRPPIHCHVHWDYQCGTNVTIRVTDDRVPYCKHEPLFPGSVVVVTTIGNDVNISQVDQATGLINGRPFAGTLEPRINFGAAMRTRPTQFYYRWTYRNLTSGEVPARLDAPVFRQYMIEHSDPTLPTEFTAERLGPVDAPAGGLIAVQPLNPPTVGSALTTWQIGDAHRDLASETFPTQSLIGFTAARFELLLELFDAAGTRINWDVAGIQGKVVDPTVPAPLPLNYTAVPATAYQVIDGGHVVGLRFILQVDNNRCTAEILPLSAAGLDVDANCGFYKYTSVSQNVRLSFRASHPNNHAELSFDVTKGPGNPVGGGINVPAHTPVGAPVAGYSHSAGTYTSVSPGVPVSALLGPTCPAAAFSEALSVVSTATDGWGGPGNLNAFDHGAFALAPQTP
ncbi:MAG TPA: hypothetical protein VJ276_05785 [Thermoanaerobaculia bacterium]|nr:hypothetical protein [Thermoanaerobaculia bacterium]